MKALAAQGEKGLLDAHGGDARRHDDGRIRKDGRATGSRRAGTRVSSGRTPSSSTSRCWSCSAYLRANGFKTFIVSGGGVEFMRPWTEKAYGIPPEQVVGSSGVTQVRARRGGKPAL